MGEQNQELQNQLNQLDTKNEKLKQITQEIKDLIDGDDNTKFELAGKLTSEVANALKDNQDSAKLLQEIIGKINDESLSQEDKISLIQLTNFIQPYIQNFDFSIENDNSKGNFVKNIEKEDVEAATTRIQALINKLSGETVGNLKQTLTNILQILVNPTKDNTQKLQDFLHNKLDGDNKTKFYKENHGKSGRDGQFGPNTMEGLNIFLNSVDKYIESLNNSKNIQEEHDKTNKENAERQQELINDLNINRVMAILPDVTINDEEIKNLINLISEIENGGYKSEEEMNWEKQTLQDQINKDKEELNNINNNLNDWNKYTKDQKSIAEEIYRSDDGKFKADERKDFKEAMRLDRQEQEAKKTMLEERISRNQKHLNKLGNNSESSNDMIKRLLVDMDKLLEKQITKLNNDNEQLQNRKTDYESNQNLSDNAKKAFENRYKESNAKIDLQIAKNNSAIEKISGFKNSDIYEQYQTKLNTNVDNNTRMNELLGDKNNAKIDGNKIIAKLRGDWKKLDNARIKEKKNDIATKLNFYTENWEILPEDVKEVLVLAKEALESKTDKDIDDKSYKVYLLEQKLDMPENMKDPKVHNSIDGKFGHETYNALINYIDTSLEKNAEIKANDIKVTLRGEWKNLTTAEEIQAKKEEIAKKLNDLKNSKRETRSDDQKIILGLAKVALNSQSNANDDDKSNEVLVLENKLVELGYMPKEAHDGKNDGPDGKFGDKTYNALKKCLNGDNPDYKSN